MKRVYVAHNLIDAYLLQGALETQGIESIVQGDFLWSIRGEIPMTIETCPQVWVINEEDFETAMEIVGDLQFQKTAVAGASVQEWICEKCGVSNEEQYSECWHCGAEQKK